MATDELYYLVKYNMEHNIYYQDSKLLFYNAEQYVEKQKQDLITKLNILPVCSLQYVLIIKILLFHVKLSFQVPNVRGKDWLWNHSTLFWKLCHKKRLNSVNFVEQLTGLTTSSLTKFSGLCVYIWPSKLHLCGYKVGS